VKQRWWAIVTITQILGDTNCRHDPTLNVSVSSPLWMVSGTSRRPRSRAAWRQVRDRTCIVPLRTMRSPLRSPARSAAESAVTSSTRRPGTPSRPTACLRSRETWDDRTLMPRCRPPGRWDVPGQGDTGPDPPHGTQQGRAGGESAPNWDSYKSTQLRLVVGNPGRCGVRQPTVNCFVLPAKGGPCSSGSRDRTEQARDERRSS
jgi:hypothetical protein